MRAQNAAHKLIQEAGQPLTSKHIAQLALERQLVSSNSQDPVQSISSTIEKNIREGKYNDPKLVFMYMNGTRHIALPSMQGNSDPHSDAEKSELRVSIPSELYEQLQLAKHAQIGEARDIDETVALLLQKGLSAFRPQIKRNLLDRLEKIAP